ncbi:hypothetical protein [Hyalangium versicolor]|uniref:hypothetical protein n=1 Tax=Hyalangium versicolor TaxID=2861190 RepID=UPI001CCFB875|nr:hypothetical protein [Hyalangium versicolor]
MLPQLSRLLGRPPRTHVVARHRPNLELTDDERHQAEEELTDARTSLGSISASQLQRNSARI